MMSLKNPGMGEMSTEDESVLSAGIRVQTYA